MYRCPGMRGETKAACYFDRTTNVPKLLILRSLSMNPRILIFLAIFTLAVNAVAQTPPADSGAKRVAGTVLKPTDDIYAAGIEGKLMIGFTVSETGEVKDPIWIAGPIWPCDSSPRRSIEKLVEAAKQNVLSSRFAPAIKDGKAISTSLMITFDLDRLENPTEGPATSEKNANGDNPPRFIHGGVLNGKALYLQKPLYPPEARSKRVAGAVRIQVLIDENGKIISAGAVSGPGMLQWAARDAACSSRFSPTTLEGYPVKVSGVITYNFVP